ncbi:MAG: zinc-dependent alcohol dehydrogenase family protein [Gemmatimonadetes bacterium]|nr:zinc-dependent alcohol dehydrogenase family protein [Gemmatimonadota bacterium]
MKAMVLDRITNMSEDETPLTGRDLPRPVPAAGEVLVRVSVCGVCHTELDEIEGRTPPPELPIIPGHQVVGAVVECGEGAALHEPGARVGVAWLYHACGRCEFCTSGRENLCQDFRATGRDANGGYAEYMVVPEAFAFPIPEALEDDAEVAPLLCAGAVGYRSLRLTGLRSGYDGAARSRAGGNAATGAGRALGLTGFGASGHLVLTMARHLYPGIEVHVFARNPGEREFARELGAVWTGDTTDTPPRELDAVIDTTPAWKPVVEALRCLAPGGRLVVNAIRKEDADRSALLGIDYDEHLWREKELKTVANVTRADVTELLAFAARTPLRPTYQEYPLERANEALLELKRGTIRGAKVLRISKRS